MSSNLRPTLASSDGRGGIKWSPDLEGFLAGKVKDHEIRCVLCQMAPCACPPLGSPEYLALVERVHQ